MGLADRKVHLLLSNNFTSSGNGSDLHGTRSQVNAQHTISHVSSSSKTIEFILNQIS
ncbi:hypothetical protein FD08_GL003518 [Lentilactobacillus parakefiri DSM 10551]|nr:hypothetical protein FD08_GL003518 [Lentilactobacillus parakefiri DSM 10551]